jgi:formylglycine-generating enzyme required for sulfatase activity
VQVTTTPESGAAVLLNGQETGKTTPCTLERVPAGQHTLSASLNMYATATQQFTMQAGETLPLTVTLKPSFGEVSVNTNPKSDVYVNGQLKGNGLWQGRLNPGIYTFEAKLDKHATATEQRTVAIGEPLELTLQPEPRYGTLNVVTNPMDATIRIAGKDYGTTPNTLKNFLIGDYTVELSLPGYATAYEKVTINEGETATLNTTLQNGRQVTISSTPTGASLTIDGKPAGTTPYTGSLTFGNHTLRIEQDGNRVEKQITISQTGGETDFSLSFGPQTFTETVKGVSFKMVAIKGGTFEMGSNDGYSDEKPVHSVTVSDFYMGETEVTQALWKSVMGTNPSNFKGDNLPVETVSWNDAKEFITKLNRLTGKNYRLPTEAEWEYAAGGGLTNRTKWAGTNTESSLGSYAWYGSNSNSQTHPVGTKSPNGLGLFDMSGNVWEWCSDWKGDYSSGGQTNPQGPASGSGRVLRGGSWGISPSGCRVAYRNHNTPDYRNVSLGFRVALAP